jgi:hypothetical protein
VTKRTKTERVINRLRSLPRSTVITETINELQRLTNALEAAYRTIDATREHEKQQR